MVFKKVNVNVWRLLATHGGDAGIRLRHGILLHELSTQDSLPASVFSIVFECWAITFFIWVATLAILRTFFSDAFAG